MGIRIICLFIEELKIVENFIEKNFNIMEVDRKVHNKYSEFGYESTHLLIKIPDDILRVRGNTGCEVAEIQIRTILQDAWAEVEHELYYKARFNPIDMPMKRKLASVNASLALADFVFQDIRDHQKKYGSQTDLRRHTFYDKIEESIDTMLISDLPVQKINRSDAALIDMDRSIDDLLVDALTAHNEKRFNDAILIYSRILELNPEKIVCSLIYNHRGMANFAQSRYQDAIADFTKALELDNASCKAAYYRGLVHSVLGQYSEAIGDYSLSLKINPYQSFCLFRRGQAYYHMDDFPKALSDCETSLKMEPKNESVKRFRDLLLGKLKM
jgi:putative GTP pyrophosphokinase